VTTMLEAFGDAINGEFTTEKAPRPMYCPCKNELPDPCPDPGCRATVEGGVCKAIRGQRTDHDLGFSIILTRRTTR